MPTVSVMAMLDVKDDGDSFDDGMTEDVEGMEKNEY